MDDTSDVDIETSVTGDIVIRQDTDDEMVPDPMVLTQVQIISAIFASKKFALFCEKMHQLLYRAGIYCISPPLQHRPSSLGPIKL